MKKNLFVLVFWVLYFSFFSHTFAELRGDIIITPEYPKAYEQVTARLQSYSFDVDLVMITWKIDGVVVASGLGKKSITFKAKGTGEVSALEVSVSFPNGDSVVIVYNLSPQSVDLVWETVESYTPPFYEGKTLPGEGSLVRVTALPSFVYEGRLINPNAISYSWSLNDEALPSLSGTGKQTLTTRLDYLSDESVFSVTAKSPTGQTAQSRITVYPVETKPIFYTYNELLGVDLSRAIFNRLETKKEVTLKIEPYYLSKVSGADSGDTYFWSLDGLPITTKNKTTVTLKPKEDSYGSKKLSVTVENTKRRMQQAVAELLVVFDSR